MTARNPGLCRRVAAAVQGMGLEPPDRVVVAQLVEHAARFEDLPDWLRAIVTRAEGTTVR